MWDRLLVACLRAGVRTGRLRLTLADGSCHEIGPGGPPEVGVALHDPTLPRRFFRNPDLAMARPIWTVA